MSVPPPSCTFISVSTGSAAVSVKSTTLVSNTARWVRSSVFSEVKIEAVTAAWMTLSAIEPDWSTSTITCQRSMCLRTREKNSGSRMIRRPDAASKFRRLRRMVAGASKLAAIRCRDGLAPVQRAGEGRADVPRELLRAGPRRRPG